jgi:heptosyltransferase-2
MHGYKKLLIIQTAFLGDVILTTPLIEVVHSHFPECKIDFLTIPKCKNIIESNPHIRKIIIFDKKDRDRGIKGLNLLATSLRVENYDVCLTPHRSWRSAYLTKSTRAAVRIGFNSSSWTGAFTHLIRYDREMHEIERNLSLVNELGIERKNKIYPKLYSTPNDTKIVLEILKNLEEGQINEMFAVAPGSIWTTKRWPMKHYQEFCRLMSENEIQLLLLGSKEDAVLCQRLSADCQNCINLAGKLTLRQTESLLKRCLGLLTNDSAPLHLGSAANIPVYAIFGPTIPQFGFGPIADQSMIFERRNLSCRPCGIHGGKTCPTRTFACMEYISPVMVFNKVMNNLRN